MRIRATISTCSGKMSLGNNQNYNGQLDIFCAFEAFTFVEGLLTPSPSSADLPKIGYTVIAAETQDPDNAAKSFYLI